MRQLHDPCNSTGSTHALWQPLLQWYCLLPSPFFRGEGEKIEISRRKLWYFSFDHVDSLSNKQHVLFRQQIEIIKYCIKGNSDFAIHALVNNLMNCRIFLSRIAQPKQIWEWIIHILAVVCDDESVVVYSFVCCRIIINFESFHISLNKLMLVYNRWILFCRSSMEYCDWRQGLGRTHWK